MNARAVFGVLLFAVIHLQAAIPVLPSGFGPQTFNTRPDVAEWATWFVPGGSSDISTPQQLDALVQSQSVTSFTAALWVDFSATPFFNVQSSWSGSRQAVYTGPGGTAAHLLLANLSNAHSAPLTMLRIGYHQDVLLPSGPLLETVAGQRVFYSFTGEPGSWVFIPELSNAATSGYRQVWLNLPGWPPGASLYLLWADDNSQFEDGCYTIDNFAADNLVCDSFPWLQPFQNLNVIEGRNASLSINLCPHELYNFQWFKDNALRPGATNSTLIFAPMRLDDAGEYFAALSGPSGNVQSRRVTVTVVPDGVPPAALVACRLIETNEAFDAVGVFFSEPVDTNAAAQTRNYLLRRLDGISTPVAIQGVSFTSGSHVVLHTDPLPGGGLELVVSNSLDQAAMPNLLSPNPTVLPVQRFVEQTIVPPNQVWRYFEATNLTAPPAWTSRFFDDNAWLVGMSALGFPASESLPPPFQIFTTLGPPSVNGAITTYFRTRFELTSDQTNRVLQLMGVFDDGAVVYLNGKEIWRERLPAGPLSPTAYATNAPEATGPLASAPLDVFIPGLLQLTNVLAVEVHQVTVTSGDVVMGLTARLSAPPCQPRLSITRGAGSVTINWDCGGTLQVSRQLSPTAWQDITTFTNQFTTNISAGATFFRVRP